MSTVFVLQAPSIVPSSFESNHGHPFAGQLYHRFNALRRELCGMLRLVLLSSRVLIMQSIIIGGATNVYVGERLNLGLVSQPSKLDGRPTHKVSCCRLLSWASGLLAAYPPPT